MQNNFPNLIRIDLEKIPSISPNSWVTISHDRDSNGNIKRYRLLSVVENAECYFNHEAGAGTIIFKRGSLLILDVISGNEFQLHYHAESIVEHKKGIKNEMQITMSDLPD